MMGDILINTLDVSGPTQPHWISFSRSHTPMEQNGSLPIGFAGDMHGDILILQLAEEKDKSGRWQYEHIDRDIMAHGRLFKNCMALLSKRDPRT